ncbi:hypothetical protein [Candidatus Vallotia cooleyia]|uniref:hypothetical protein n=1 Tax=Candidatus Vallotiella adelgis TaxID=1177211 RepID=UPI001D01A77F|nr:hypothetical protein [Candidatus Vallotia cooleyia]UDG82311.1 hypothetical protein GJV44_00572 [Candidatus Vallotia cooleyia]
MKKSLLVVSLLAAITLAACSKKDESTDPATASDAAATSTPVAAGSDPASAAATAVGTSH